MTDLKTVGDAQPDNIVISDPLIRQQKEDVARMRTSLLAVEANPELASTAIRNITVLRVYHQIARIIKYIELMDKLEDKLYESIEMTIDKANAANPSTWMTLLNIQERLQRTMQESHKLLQPYLDIQEYTYTDLTQGTSQVSSDMTLMDKSSRDKLRDSARQVLAALEAADGSGESS